jgi:2-octaprenyl-6-methoxyphenol hydroxylase
MIAGYIGGMQTDILILGGGLVGLTLALALDAHGISSTVVDPADPAKQQAAGFDGRASAIASAPWKMLEAIGLGEALTPHGCPIRRIEVRDGLQTDCLDFTPEGESVGIMVENRILRQTLFAAAVKAKHITLAYQNTADVVRDANGVTATLSDGRTVKARLLVAAEGRNSPTRAAAGLNVATWQYNHRAIISAITHAIPHNNVAHEIFYPAGPFALLPMLGEGGSGNRSALVWTVAEADAAGVLALNDTAFAAEVRTRMGGILGEIRVAAPRSSYPLGFHHAAQITAERLVLVGDAAHGIHPIAGQGLNLGFRDAAALVEVLVDGARLGLDFGDAQLLSRYQRWRSLDTLMVAGATDVLTRIYGVPGRGARGIRRFGMRAIQKLPPLKNRLMAEARGESGALPKLLVGELV